jgi:hypothetical protein
MFETFFNEMLDTITKEFSSSQRAFLRFTLRPLFHDKTRALFEILLECEKNESHIDPYELSKLKDELRRQFMLLPLYTTKSREEVMLIKENQEKFKHRWRSLARSKGIE